MTELKIKVNEGKIYFPKSLTKLYFSGEPMVAWFCNGQFSPLMRQLGLDENEANEMVGHSNQFIIIKPHTEFSKFLKKEVYDLSLESKRPELAYEAYLRGICADCTDFKVGESRAVSVPRGFVGFSAGEYVLISNENNGLVRSEVWEKSTWERIKEHLIETKKLKEKAITKYKNNEKGLELNKNGGIK